MFDAAKEVERRYLREREKAERKYGRHAGNLPGGDPERDVTDYALNELVGLIRYGEMIQARARRAPESAVKSRAAAIAARIRRVGMSLGAELAELREELREAGLLQGDTEYKGDR